MVFAGKLLPLLRRYKYERGCMSLLEEIRENWKLDAKIENSHRYFYHVNEVEKICSGKRSYVIGRKGSGKTAICEYLVSISDHETFSEKLSFKNFPFNELYSLKNAGYTTPNQYITFWKYIIYSHVCKMMAKNQAIDPTVQVPLAKLYAPEPVDSLHRWIKKWTANDFSLQILGTGGKVGYKEDNQSVSWIDKVDTLETIIANYIDGSTYYVIFDELDEDYKNMIDKDQYLNYTHLLTSLFKAIQDIKGIFKNGNAKVFPVIFLRDDIYSVITDPDKTKWDDYKIELEWDKRKLQELLAFRISRAIDAEKQPLPFDKAWLQLFDATPVRMGHRQSRDMSSFDFILRSTHSRPRDFIKYIQACAEETKEPHHKISASTVLKVDKSFSNYLKRELIDEIHGVIPDISIVLDIISQIRKQTFSFSEFTRAYEMRVKDGVIKNGDVSFTLKILFLFSVLGNQPSQQNQTVFRYLNKDAELNFRENLVVHRGLFKALQIL